MKSDARLLLNKRKWNKASGGPKADNRKSHGALDARKILNLKRNQKFKTPVVGSFMRTKTATALIASRIRKEISPASQVPGKRVQLSKDGNIIVTSKSNSISRVHGRNEMPGNTNLVSRNRLLENRIQYEPSMRDTDDLEHTAIEDLMDLESLPTSLVSSNATQNANLSRKSVVGQVIDKRHTMVADQLSQPSSTLSYKVYVSNLHPTVSRQDVVELFGDIGMIKSAEMLRPGTAVIDFYNEVDAEKACEIYHNRLLDGLPMKCYTQNTPQSERIAISQRLGNRMAFHANDIQRPVSSVTSPNSRSRYNPRNVQFTVKLT